MNASDLRIGNWYLCYNPMAGVSVAERFENWVYYLDFEGYGVEGVPLTGEILEKAGFKKEAALQLYHFCEVEIGYLDNPSDFFYAYGDQTAFIKYVHQLQSLYFALTGEELKIEL